MTPHFRTRWLALLGGLGACAWLLLPAPLLASERIQDELPEMGTAAQATLSLEDEYRLGLMVMRGLRESGAVLDDPEITEYLQSLGTRLSSQAHEGNLPRQFSYFMVRETSINAFALPGGFIGVNEGLMIETANESELAGVLAHETAHVTQRHIARSIQDQGRTGLVSAAAMLAAILVGAVAHGGGNAVMGAVAAAQGIAMQSQINFTRDNEMEADRIGMGLLASAGFDPNGLPTFFETMFRRTQLGPDQIPEMLRSHPVESTRIAETKARAAQYPAVTPKDSPSYALMKERARVLSTPPGADPRTYYAGVKDGDPRTPLAQIYGKALADYVAGDPAKALPVFERLRANYPQVLQFHTAYAQAQVATGDNRGALLTLEHALKLAPRNVPVTVRYGQALLQAGRPKAAHEVLLDLFNNVPPSQEQIRLTAIAANAAGDVADAYSYMAEYDIMGGDLPLAINQLELALSVPNLTEVQRARYVARIKELREAMPKRQQRAMDEGQGSSGGHGSPHG